MMSFSKARLKREIRKIGTKEHGNGQKGMYKI
jgi:hypothetical protein